MSDPTGRLTAIWVLASALAAVTIAAAEWHRRDRPSQPPPSHPVHRNRRTEAAVIEHMGDDLAFGCRQTEADYDKLWEAIDEMRATKPPNRQQLHR